MLIQFIIMPMMLVGWLVTCFKCFNESKESHRMVTKRGCHVNRENWIFAMPFSNLTSSTKQKIKTWTGKRDRERGQPCSLQFIVDLERNSPMGIRVIRRMYSSEKMRFENGKRRWLRSSAPKKETNRFVFSYEPNKQGKCLIQNENEESVARAVHIQWLFRSLKQNATM